MKLYFSPGTCALATHIALEDVGADYELQRLDFSKQEQQSSEFLAVNPKGRVPALVTERGILTETPAMLAFLAQSHPKAALAPLDDPFAFAEFQAFNSYLCSTLHVAHAHLGRGHRWSNDPAAIASMTAYVPTSSAAAYEHVEQDVFKGPFVLGDAYSLADAYLFTVAQWMERDSLNLKQFPKIVAHRAMMAERPPVKRAFAAQAALSA